MAPVDNPCSAMTILAPMIQLTPPGLSFSSSHLCCDVTWLVTFSTPISHRNTAVSMLPFVDLEHFATLKVKEAVRCKPQVS